tara:strand:- start:18898 stop:19893 length:996 start_codon:yes stop_codon:yes gene_type:complete
MATNNTPSFVTHQGNGTSDTFAISFAFLSDEEIDVTVNAVSKTIGTHYTISGQNVEFITSEIPPNGAAIRFQRNTDISQKKVDFQDGSVLTESDLDTNTEQILFALQENADDTASGVVPLGTNLTANNKILKNLLTPVDPQDAATKGYVDTNIAGFVKTDGSVPMAGSLNANSNKITNLADGTANSDAVNKGQLDAGIANANTAIGQAGASASAAASSATQAAASASQAAASAVTASNSASTAQNLARTSIFVGFQRLSSGMLRMVYNNANDPNSTIYRAEDFIQNGVSHAYFLGEDILSTTSPNAPKFTLAINNPVNRAYGLAGHLVLDI